MHDVDVDQRIRDLCRQILDEQDPAKVRELLSSLRGMVQSDQDETRLRMRFIANYYRDRIRPDLDGSDSSDSDDRRGARIRALLQFLGLARMRPEGEVEG